MTIAAEYSTDVCIVGGGPAGMVLGLLLAHQGIKVLVLESHPDFSREYRGEVLMPRFTQMARQIGLFDYLEKIPHLKLKNLELFYKDWRLASVEFKKISPEVPYAVWMPQTVFLNAMHEKAKAYPNFQMLFGMTARSVIQENGRIIGVIAEQHGQKTTIHSRMTVGADGRSSAILKSGGFEMEYEHYNFDIIWFTVKKPANYDNTVRAFFSTKRNYIVLPKFPDLIQCGLVARPGEFAQFRQKGITALQKEILSGHSAMHEFARSLKDFSPFSVLQARIHYVKNWAKDGCLLIGDAAHTCSPAGAIGVSVAVGTAIVAADVIVKALKANDVSAARLNRVQEIRGKEVKEIQAIQKRVTNVVFVNMPYLQWIAITAIYLAARIGFFGRTLKTLAVMKEPLPIDPEIRL